MMNAPINPVDDGKCRAPQLVIKAASDETTNNRFAVGFTLERPGGWRAGCSVFCEGLMQPLDDIAALAKRAQALLGVRGQNPARRTGGLGEPQPLERPHPSDPDLPQGIAPRIAFGTEIDHTLRPSRFPGQRPIEPCPAFGRDLRFKPASNLQLRSRAELARDEVAGSRAQSRADIVPADDEIGTIVRPTPHKDMNMGMLGVPVVDGDPVEPRTEITRGLVHQLPCKAAQAR